MADIKPFEVISTNSLEVVCEGSGGALGHPKVYLHIDKSEGEVMCGYCSRVYRYKPATKRQAS